MQQVLFSRRRVLSAGRAPGPPWALSRASLAMVWAVLASTLANAATPATTPATTLASAASAAPAGALAGTGVMPEAADPANGGHTAAGESRRLRGTYWKLVRLKGRPVRFHEDRPEAHLLLDAREWRASGSGGCNRFGGVFRLDGPRLSLDSLASTEMACREGMQQEADYLAGLSQVAGYRVRGQRLSLLDAQGRALLEFEAVDLR